MTEQKVPYELLEHSPVPEGKSVYVLGVYDADADQEVKGYGAY